MRHLTNIDRTPVIAELVALAAKHTKFDVVYRDTPITIAEMDWCDAAESWDNGYTPPPDHGSIWLNSNLGADLSTFWRELERLQAIITEPLDEPILPDDHPVYQGYLYVVDGGRIVEFIDGLRQNVGSWKAMDIPNVRKVTEVRRCDIEGRKLRLPPKDDIKNEIKPAHQRKYRKPKKTYKIKKHMS